MSISSEQRPDLPEDRRIKIRVGLRALLVIALLLGILFGSVVYTYHLAVDRKRVLDELKGYGVGLHRNEPTMVGHLARLLPMESRNRLYSAYGDRYLDFVAEPTAFSAVMIKKEYLESILNRMSRLKRIETLYVAEGLSQVEMDLIREALPSTKVEVDPRFEYGRVSVRVNSPRGPN